MHEITTDVLTTSAQLEALRPEWTRLWRAVRATPFQAPAWLIPWWRHFGEGTLHAIALRRGGALVGVVPLYVRATPAERRMVLVGTGNTDHLDALLAPELADECGAAALAHLARYADDWDVCDLQQLAPGSPLLVAPLPARIAEETRADAPHAVATLPLAPAALAGQLSPSLRRHLAYDRRRAARTGRVRFETADAARLPGLLDALFRLHGARWADRAEPGMLADEAVRAFHAEATAELLALGALRLHALRLDDRVAAVIYGFSDGRCEYYYLGGFDPAYKAISPGTLVIAYAMEQAIQSGARAFDFLRGQERYKYDWGATDRPSYRRLLRPVRARVMS